MSDLSPRLSMPFLLPSQAQKHVTHNEALSRLDTLVQATAATRNLTTPPASPAAGETHIVPVGATGPWAGQDQAIATHDGTAWTFFAPQPGWRVYVTAEAAGLVWSGSAWAIDRAPLDDLPGLGIGTSHDQTNRLSVASPATLLTHVGAGHQLKINKAAQGDTASLLFQTGFDGRAEMGTAGSDAFEIKVSPDGAAWTTALSFDPATGLASGAAVQATPVDTTPGRLMRADFGYGRGNLLGSVTLAAGQPTGAVLERAATANGEYLRLADGTQICQHELTLAFVDSTLCTATWTFPAAFVAGSAPQVMGSLNTADLAATAPAIAPNGVSGLTLGALTPISAVLQVHALTGQSFQAGNTVVMRATAIGRWA
ncbi:MAG: DUF2793 domain-containing protein [Rhodobacteraceae bacterium]|nr:MAG: DUF2793 domain-containing protein [Paracoccaceae bacterium]